jgi:adenylyltransferase/sulfurtransferase
LKLILGIGELLIGKFILFDALEMSLVKLMARKNESCLICGENPTMKELIDYDQLCGHNSSSLHTPP